MGYLFLQYNQQLLHSLNSSFRCFVSIVAFILLQHLTFCFLSSAMKEQKLSGKPSLYHVKRTSNFYYLPMKFRQGNDFSRVCLSVHRVGPPYTGPQSYLPPVYSTLAPVPRTCSNLFNLDLNPRGPRPACSNLFIMKHVRPASWLLASYCNAYLFYIFVLFSFTLFL